MKGTFLFSAILHIIFLALVAFMPKWTHKQVVYTPVYTVDLLSLPRTESPPPSKASDTEASQEKKSKPKTPSPEIERKPLEFTPQRADKNILKELEKFEEKIKKKEMPKEKSKEIKETPLSEMLTAYEKKWKDKKPQKQPETTPKEEKKPTDLLEELSKLEKKWDKPEKKPEGEKEGPEQPVDKKMQLRQANFKSQSSAPAVSSALNTYYGLVLSRIHENWLNPLSTKYKDSKQEIPGVVFFRILANGEVDAIRIETSSGDELFDSLIKNAIKKSSPLPPPPKEVSDDKLEVFLDFNYIFQK
jgi:TonB family protein